tara:strand:- start:571 stop:720 length:150 start_codon:yes stop_codon:yes gene_type:complete
LQAVEVAEPLITGRAAEVQAVQAASNSEPIPELLLAALVLLLELEVVLT